MDRYSLSRGAGGSEMGGGWGQGGRGGVVASGVKFTGSCDDCKNFILFFKQSSINDLNVCQSRTVIELIKLSMSTWSW